MQIDWVVVFTIAAPIIIAILSVFLDRYFRERPNLIAYTGHIANFRVRGESEISIYTHSIVLRNAGRKSATNVRVGHVQFPNHYQITPSIVYQINDIPDSGKEILIPSLVPNEQVTISYLYEQPLQIADIHSYIKDDEGFAKIVTVLPFIQQPKWKIIAMLIFAVVGLITVIYFVWELIEKLFLENSIS